MTGSRRGSGTQAVEQAQGPRGAELSERAHREIGLWLAATPPEQRNMQRFLAEAARTHGLAARRGDRGWDTGAARRAFGRVAEQEWLHTQMPTDSARNWLMAPAQRNRCLRSSHSYWEQRASHPEWAAFDPAPRSEGAGRQELPPGQNWFSWQVHGRPDLSPIAEPRDTSPVVSEAEFRRAFPGFSFIRDERPDGYGRYWGTVGAEWRREYFVNVPNRWGIQDPNGGVPATLRCNRVVAPHLVAALDELDRKGLLYLVKTIESYAPRYQLGNKVLSSHAFCVSFDMNRKEYPQLPRAKRDELVAKGLPLPQQDWRLISIMQKHGFSYGGYWKGGHYDPMHFEFSDREALGL